VVIVTVRPVFANVKMDGLAALVQDTMANLELQDIVLLGLLLNAQFVRTRQLNVVDLLVVIVTRPLVNVNARILGLVVPAVLVTENQEHLVTALLLPPLLPLLLKTMLCARFAHTKKRSVVVLLEEPATEILVLVNVKMESGGACAGRNGKPGANGYRVPGASGGIKCPICPYKREECGGASRGACNSKTGECTCKAPYTGGACSNRPGHVGAPGYNLPKPKPKPVTQPPVEQVKCPICAFKGVECGGPTHGDCNTKSGDCACKTGYSGGACSARGDKVGDRPKSSGNHKCPICPYKREECGGATRGTCDRNTGNCACKAPYTGGACSNRPGHKGAPGYNPPRATEADTTNYSGTGSGNEIWGTAVAVLGAVVVVLFVVIIVLVVKLTAKEEERV